MNPTVGRMVYYKSCGSAGGEYPSADRAAIITAVHDESNVDLCVLNPTGMYFSQNVMRGFECGSMELDALSKGADGYKIEKARGCSPTGFFADSFGQD